MVLSRMIPVCFLVVLATPAEAQPAPTQADLLFREGRNLMAAGKIAEACAAFEQSQKLDPAVTTLINLAACREKLGQLATAWRLLLDVDRQTQSASDDAAAQLRKIALDRAGKLEPRVSKLTIRVPDQSRGKLLEILLNGEQVTDEWWNRALPVEGGTYTIIARAPRASEWSISVTLAPESDAQTVDIPDLWDRQQRLGTENNTISTRRRWATWKPWTIIATGATVTGASGLLHRLAYRNFKEFDRGFLRLSCSQAPHICSSAEIPRVLGNLLDRARQQQAMSAGGYILGSSLIAVGAVLLYLNRARPMEQKISFTRSVVVIPVASEDTLGVLVSMSH